MIEPVNHEQIILDKAHHEMSFHAHESKALLEHLIQDEAVEASSESEAEPTIRQRMLAELFIYSRQLLHQSQKAELNGCLKDDPNLNMLKETMLEYSEALSEDELDTEEQEHLEMLLSKSVSLPPTGVSTEMFSLCRQLLERSWKFFEENRFKSYCKGDSRAYALIFIFDSVDPDTPFDVEKISKSKHDPGPQYILTIESMYRLLPQFRARINLLRVHKDRYGVDYVIINMMDELLSVKGCPYLPNEGTLAQPRGKPCISSDKLSMWAKTVPLRSCFKNGMRTEVGFLLMRACCRFTGFIVLVFNMCFIVDLSLEDIVSITWLMDYFGMIVRGRVIGVPSVGLKLQQALLRQSAKEITQYVPSSAVHLSQNIMDYIDDPKLVKEPAQNSPIQYMANNIVYAVLVMKVAEVFRDDLLHELAGRHLIGMYSTLYQDNATKEWAQTLLHQDTIKEAETAYLRISKSLKTYLTKRLCYFEFDEEFEREYRERESPFITPKIIQSTKAILTDHFSHLTGLLDNGGSWPPNCWLESGVQDDSNLHESEGAGRSQFWNNLKTLPRQHKRMGSMKDSYKISCINITLDNCRHLVRQLYVNDKRLYKKVDYSSDNMKMMWYEVDKFIRKYDKNVSSRIREKVMLLRRKKGRYAQVNKVKKWQDFKFIRHTSSSGGALEPYVGTGKRGLKLPGSGSHNPLTQFSDAKYIRGETGAYIGVGTYDGTTNDQDLGVNYLLCGQIGQAFWHNPFSGICGPPAHGLDFATNPPPRLPNLVEQRCVMPELHALSKAYERSDMLGVSRTNKSTGQVCSNFTMSNPMIKNFLQTATKVERLGGESHCRARSASPENFFNMLMSIS